MKNLSAYIVFEKKSDIPKELIDFLHERYYKNSQRFFFEPKDNEPCVLSTSWSNRSYSFIDANSPSFFSDDATISWKHCRTECKTIEDFIKFITNVN